MRPVAKGNVPTDPKGEEIVFKKYARSRRYLIDRIGEYCSYCERKIQANLAVEHVRPKKTNPDLKLSWDNFLLGCTNCNSTKGDKKVVLEEFVWPDMDPTFEYFSYDASGVVKVNENITDENLRKRIEATIELVGLQNRAPKKGSIAWQEASDRRHEHRMKAYIDSREASDTYKKANKAVRELMRGYIEMIVVADGFWTIWMEAFEEFPEVTEMLKNCIPGTRWEEVVEIDESSAEVVLDMEG
ncbi:MAG: HNH endonuclease [Bacteroidota bacterium]